MERFSAVQNDFQTRAADGNQIAPSSIHESGREARNEDALEELEALGLYLAQEHRLEREEMRRRSRRAKWTESKRRHRRER